MRVAPPLAVLPPQAARNRGSRTRLFAAIVRAKHDRTLFDAAIDGLRHAADALGPAESLLDPFAVFQGQGVTFLASDAGIDSKVASLPGDMRGHASLPQVGDKVSAVEALVRL